MDRESTEMPVFDADASLPGVRPVRRAVGGGRRGGTARGVGVAVAALVLLTGGVVVGGMLENPGPNASPSPNAASPTTPPTACVPVGTDSVPFFRLRVAGTDVRYGGLVGYTHRPGFQGARVDWRVPAWDGQRPTASGPLLELETERGACVRYVVAEYAGAGLEHPRRDRERRPLTSAAVEPAATNLGLGQLPDGDWVVRAQAYYETRVSGPQGLIVVEYFFRVRVGPGPFGTPRPSPTPTADPTPAVVPDVACGPAPASEADVSIALSAPGSDAVAGVPDDAAPGIVTVAPGDEAELAVGGDACATSWSFTIFSILGTERGEPDRLGELDNPTDDPRYAAQNRWRLSVPVGTFELLVSFHFGPGVEVVRLWHLVGREFTVPEAFLIDGDGNRVPVLPGCGLSFTLANGYSASDTCGDIGYPGGLEVLHVPAWSPVVLEIPGWTITSWNGTCGRATGAEGNQYFETVNGCYLGNYSVAPGASPPAPVRFLARPGEQAVQLGLSASRDGTTFSVAMFGVVDGE